MRKCPYHRSKTALTLECSPECMAYRSDGRCDRLEVESLKASALVRLANVLERFVDSYILGPSR